MEVKNALCLALMLALLATAQAVNTYIPSYTGGDNYYNFYGGPGLSASVTGTNEFDRGDTVTLYVDLTNYGRMTGFKQDKVPNTATEYALANAEQQEEAKITTALGIKGTLISNTSQIEVKSGDQVVQSLKSGDKTNSPLKFTIKIAEHAPAGTYPLILQTFYDYQSNVMVYASHLENIPDLPPVFVNAAWSYFYDRASQNLTIPIVVKKNADFELIGANGTLSAGQKKGELTATYKNIGDEPIKDAIARISIFKPFSSTDDQAYIGTLDPQEEKAVIFRLDVDSDATPKEYGINSEIKYTDINGDTVISESMKIPVAINAKSQSLLLPAIAVLIIIVAAGGYLYRRKQKKANTGGQDKNP
jgi:hypothetical protein